MRLVFFTHSVVSDWNHGNAHFQRGVLRALMALGHDAVACEPTDGWSRANLLADQGDAALGRFENDFPDLQVVVYRGRDDIEAALDGADAVIVHEWTDPDLVASLGRLRGSGGRFALLFHDTHHRAVSAPEELAALDLDGYDGVLAFGEVLSETYRRRGWGRDVHTWHEAADTTVFTPRAPVEPRRDLVWVGNWGDGERARELTEFLIEPVRRLGLTATVHGVRYPDGARRALAAAGITYEGWLRNSAVPSAFAAHRATVHVPRRFYADQLPGIPTIRVFEALACGIPLVTAPWRDAEGLFRPGRDYLVAESADRMVATLARLLADRELAESVARCGRETILARHTCHHRAAQLLGILAGMVPAARDPAPAPDREAVA